MTQLTWNRAQQNWTLRNVEPGTDQSKEQVTILCKCGCKIAETVRFDTGKMTVGALEFTDDAKVEAE